MTCKHIVSNLIILFFPLKSILTVFSANIHTGYKIRHISTVNPIVLKILLFHFTVLKYTGQFTVACKVDFKLLASAK